MSGGRKGQHRKIVILLKGKTGRQGFGRARTRSTWERVEGKGKDWRRWPTKKIGRVTEIDTDYKSDGISDGCSYPWEIGDGRGIILA